MCCCLETPFPAGLVNFEEAVSRLGKVKEHGAGDVQVGLHKFLEQIFATAI